MPYLLWGKTFATWKGKSAAVTTVRAWVDAFPRTARGYPSLYLFGQNGVGKTHLAAACCNALIDRWDGDTSSERLSPVRYITAPALLARVRATYRPDSAETEDAVYEDLSHAPLLVVDDVFKETAAAGQDDALVSSHTQRVYFRLIDERYGQVLPVLLVSNTPLAKLETLLGRATASRIAEMTQHRFVQVAGPDHRRGRDVH